MTRQSRIGASRGRVVKVDLTQWPEIDHDALPDQRRALYLTRRTDVTMYLVGASDAEIKQEPGLARSNVQRIIADQCSSQSLDGTRLGWRRALPSFESRASAARAPRPFAPM